jgi:hypothetical protein
MNNVTIHWSGVEVSCVDLFCGAGGLTHGFVREGLRVNAGIDLDPTCSYPYSVNNGTKFVSRDVSLMSPQEVASLFTEGTIRVLAGCAPCQPFSAYTQRYDTKADRTWSLLYEFARIVAGVLPDIVAMENVPPIKRHEVFDDFVATLSKLGYRIGYKTVRQTIGRLRPSVRESRILSTNCTSRRNSRKKPCTNQSFETRWNVAGLAQSSRSQLPQARYGSFLSQRVRTHGMGQTCADDHHPMLCFRWRAFWASRARSGDLAPRGCDVATFSGGLRVHPPPVSKSASKPSGVSSETPYPSIWGAP